MKKNKISNQIILRLKLLIIKLLCLSILIVLIIFAILFLPMCLLASLFRIPKLISQKAFNKKLNTKLKDSQKELRIQREKIIELRGFDINKVKKMSDKEFEVFYDKENEKVWEEVKLKINKGFDICCPSCHSKDYDSYSGMLEIKAMRPEDDIHWKCNNCGYIWNSEFYGQNYGYKKSKLEGRTNKYK